MTRLDDLEAAISEIREIVANTVCQDCSALVLPAHQEGSEAWEEDPWCGIGRIEDVLTRVP